MDLLPILSTLRRHKTAAGLIVLQIALTCAIVCNALFLISQRIERINADSGIPESELAEVVVSGLTRTGEARAQTDADLAALRALPGVRAVTLTNQIPFGRSSSNSSVSPSPGENSPVRVVASHYSAASDFLKTFGLRLSEGRDFLPEEYVNSELTDSDGDPKVPAVIINKALAARLFPNGSALGQSVYIYGDQPQRVVGVLETLVSPNPGGENDNAIFAMITPVRPSFRGGYFVLRGAPGQADALAKAAAAKLLANSPGQRRLMREQDTLSQLRSNYYRQDRSMVQLLAGVCVGLLVVTAFGIVGLASFWVQQRTRMIGTRRALGATRGQILRYFQTENLLLSTVGIALGMLGAYGISLALMHQYELPRLPWSYLPAGALALWALGQIAVFAPARRAAALPPVAALRGG